MRKKILCVIVCMIMAIKMLPIINVNAEAFGDYTYTMSDGEITITGVSSSIRGNVIVPDTINGYPVTQIGGAAFIECSNIENISLPQSVKAINGFAFAGCSNLKGITMPENATYIGEGAFTGCSSLTSIKIPNGITSINNSLFSFCISLTNLTIPSGVTFIGLNAFYGCTSLTSITIPDSVTFISNGAFYDCSNLTNITLPESMVEFASNSTFMYTKYYNDESNWIDGVLYIGKYAVNAKSDILGEIEIREGTKYIASSAFIQCTGLTNVVLPDSVVNIGNHAFSYCSNLTSLTISNSVTSIGSYAFDYCPNLTNIFFGGNETEWSNVIESYQEYSEISANIIYESKDISVILDNNTLIFDQPPIIENGRTLVPLRVIFEALGTNILWDDDTQTVTAQKADKTILLQIGSNEMNVDGEIKLLDVPAKIVNSRTLIPVRAVAEAFGCEVIWNGENNTVIINSLNSKF